MAMDYKFPLRIGIIGHQSLTEAEKIYVTKEIQKGIVTIQRTVENLRKKSNIKSDFFISGLSTLSDGAGRIFAKEIINLPGVLEVILPFRKELYIEDFWGEDSKTEFGNLLTYDAYPIIIDSSCSPNKELCYYNASRLVIEQCDILFAIWDETPVKNKKGGVANLIEYAQKLKIPVLTLLPKPKDDNFEKENKKNLEALKLERYLEFDKHWVVALKKMPTTIFNKNVPAIDLLENNLPSEELSKFTYLTQLKTLWHKKSSSKDASIKSVGNTIHMLLFITAGLTLIAIFFNYISFNIPLIQTLLPGSLIPWLIKINASAPLLLLIALLLVFFILILELRAKLVLRQGEWHDSEFWNKKTEIQIFKILTLVDGREVLNQNESYEQFRSNSVSSRLLLIATKEVWSSFKNTLHFDTRLKLLANELLAKNIQDCANHLLKEQTHKRLRKYLYGFFLCILINAFLWIVCWEYYPGLNLALSKYAWATEVARCTVLMIIFLCIAIKSKTSEATNNVLLEQKSHRRKNLIALAEALPDLCNSEEQLENIFSKAEETLLRK